MSYTTVNIMAPTEGAAPLQEHKKQDLSCFCIMLFLCLMALWGVQSALDRIYTTEKELLRVVQNEEHHMAALRGMMEKKWNMTS
jgi:hypothetical protein